MSGIRLGSLNVSEINSPARRGAENGVGGDSLAELRLRVSQLMVFVIWGMAAFHPVVAIYG